MADMNTVPSGTGGIFRRVQQPIQNDAAQRPFGTLLEEATQLMHANSAVQLRLRQIKRALRSDPQEPKDAGVEGRAEGHLPLEMAIRMNHEVTAKNHELLEEIIGILGI